MLQIRLEGTLWGSGDWANGQDWAGAGQVITGSVDLHGDPSFVDLHALDYHLRPGSPAVDQGVKHGALFDVDDQPLPYPSDGQPDIGADELWPLVPLEEVSLVVPQKVMAMTPAAFSASYEPQSATPQVRYHWLPAPDEGQGSPAPVYTFPFPGNYLVRVTVSNAAGELSAEQVVTAEPYEGRTYLPLALN